MLHDQGLPLFLWAETCNTVVYLQNRSPHRALGHMTLEEAFSGKKPDIGHLRIFGCITYSYIPKEKRTKLEPTAEKGIYVGYSETSKAFRIYIPAQRKVVVRRDVKFEEDRAFGRSWELEYLDQPDPQQQLSQSQGSNGPRSGGYGAIRISEEQEKMRVHQSRDESNQQIEDILDREIELIRRLMIKVSQTKTTTRKERSNNKRKTAADYESRASGALQHKVWRPGEQQQ
eukprot:PITA_15217